MDLECGRKLQTHRRGFDHALHLIRPHVMGSKLLGHQLEWKVPSQHPHFLSRCGTPGQQSGDGWRVCASGGKSGEERHAPVSLCFCSSAGSLAPRGPITRRKSNRGVGSQATARMVKPPMRMTPASSGHTRPRGDGSSRRLVVAPPHTAARSPGSSWSSPSGR